MNRPLVLMLVAMALLVIDISGAHAFPSQTQSCTNCHNDGSGSLTPNPNPINILVGGSGLLSFDVGTLPAPSGNNMIALTDLSAAALDASIGAGGDNWALATFTKSDQNIGTGAYVLDLGIGPGATVGPYDLTWYLVGQVDDSPVGTSGTFRVNVIPEPTTLAALGLGLTVLGLVTRRRRHWKRE